MDEKQPLRFIDNVPDNETSDRMQGDLTHSDLALKSPEQQVARRWMVVRQSNVWRPPTDVFELADRLVVLVEIAGMRDSEFNVVLQDRRLLISGVRQRNPSDRVAYHQMEIRYGEFRTEVQLPWSVGRDNISAVYRDGFLHVELPRARNQQIHIVDVEQEADA